VGRRGAREAGAQRTFVVMRHLRYGMRHPEDAWQYFDLKGVGGDRKAALSASPASGGRRVRVASEPQGEEAASQRVYWDSEFLQLLGGRKIPLTPATTRR
ncbi:unnamed protein product, partial [Prorocentrum cordatum]